MKYTLFHCGYNKDHLKHEKPYLDNKQEHYDQIDVKKTVKNEFNSVI